MYTDNLSLSFPCARAYVCVDPVYGLHVRRNDARTSTREWKSFHSLVLVIMVSSLRRTCKPGRRKRKHNALILALHRFTRRFLVLLLVLMLMLASHV